MNNVELAFSLFEAIGSTTSRNDKEAYLKQGKDNEVFKELLNLTYNPFVMFNIKKIPKVTLEGTSVSTYKFANFADLLERLNERRITGNAAVTAVGTFFTTCTEDEYKWYGKVLQKDLKIGITEATINKVFPNLVPTFSCMLAHPLKKFPKHFVVDRKLDGYRCLAFHYGTRVVLHTRNGKVIEGYTDIEEDIKNYLHQGYIYDGEIMSGDFQGTQTQVFKKGKTDKEGILNIFDVVSIADFENGKGKDTLATRLQILDNFDEAIQGAPSLSRVYPSEAFTNTDEDIQKVYELHTQFTSEGFEGTMVKDLDGVYELKRTYALQKIKDMDTLDLVVVAVEEGKEGTEFEGTLGALVVEFEGNTVNVGSGFKKLPQHEYNRDSLWARRADLINRTIEVKFQEITTNKEGKRSLRFPVFLRFRDDK